jgi:hypothetical protein
MIHNNPSLVLAGALAAAIATPLASQQQSSNSARANRPAAEAVAVRAQPRPPEVDGRLDDEAWRLAPIIRAHPFPYRRKLPAGTQVGRSPQRPSS